MNDEVMDIARRGVTAAVLCLTMLVLGCAAPDGQDEAARTESAPLVLYGAEMAVELAPILLAVRDIYPEGTVINNGGVVNLVGTDREADVASNAETQTLRHSVDEPDMRVIMTVAEGHYRIVARRSAGIASVADLEGKRIASYPLTSAGYFLSRMLEREGLTLSDVIVVDDLLLDFLEPAIVEHDVDAVAVWEPDSMNSLRALGDNAIVFSGDGVFPELYNLNTTAGALADPDMRREIVALVRAIIEATEAINTDPAVAAEAQAMVAESGGLYTAEEVAAAWPHVRFVASFPDDLLDVFVDKELHVAAQQQRQARSREELASLIDRSVYEEALATVR